MIKMFRGTIRNNISHFTAGRLYQIISNKIKSYIFFLLKVYEGESAHEANLKIECWVMSIKHRTECYIFLTVYEREFVHEASLKIKNQVMPIIKHELAFSATQGQL